MIDLAPDMRIAQASADPFETLRQAMVKHLAGGLDRVVLEAAAEQSMLSARARNAEAEEDLWGDILDALTGWCAPDRRL